MSNDTDYIKTEKNQIDVLIQQKKDEIADLQKVKADFEDQEQGITSPALTAQDEDASSAERQAAATQTLGQDPQNVFAAQSEPSPSTHAEQFEKSDEEIKAEAEAKFNAPPEPVVGEPADAAAAANRDPDEVQAEAKKAQEDAEKENEKSDDKDDVSETVTSQGVELPDGRGDPNKLGEAGQVEESPATDEKSGVKDTSDDQDKKDEKATSADKKGFTKKS